MIWNAKFAPSFSEQRKADGDSQVNYRATTTCGVYPIGRMIPGYLQCLRYTFAVEIYIVPPPNAHQTSPPGIPTSKHNQHTSLITSRIYGGECVY